MVTYPTGTLGYPDLGFGGYCVSAPGNNPSIQTMLNGDGGPGAGGGYYYPMGADISWFQVWENFSTSWGLSSINTYLQQNMSAAASQSPYNAYTGPSTGINMVIGAWTTASNDGSYTPASICAGQQDTYFQQFIDIFYNNGYSTQLGYTGKIYLRINWEMNYPGTTPGNYNSSQTTISGWTQPQGQQWAWGTDGVPGTSTYGTGMIGAWRRMVTVMRAEATLKGVPIQIVWNPSIINDSAGTGQVWGCPDHQYPGDDVVDVHGVDVYSNGFYNLSWDDHPGYINLPPFTTGAPRTPSGTSTEAAWANHTGDYSNAAYYYDFTDDNGYNGDGLSGGQGWGMYKSMCYALCIGPYANATNPNGTARVRKPLCIPECGGLGAQGGGNGPWAINNAVGYPVDDDPYFYPYLKSRIAWFQQQGGKFLFAIIWTGPNDTTAGPNMAASFGTTWPPVSGPVVTAPVANMGPTAWTGVATGTGVPASYRVYSANGQVRIQGTIGSNSEMQIGASGNDKINAGDTVTFSTVTITENGNL